jgi:hypothetical protein
LKDLVMRNYGKPVTEEVVREFLPLDLAFYSLWMPDDVTTAAIQSTRLDPIRTYDELIELDDVHAACAAYLVRAVGRSRSRPGTSRRPHGPILASKVPAVEAVPRHALSRTSVFKCGHLSLFTPAAALPRRERCASSRGQIPPLSPLW